MDNQLKEKWVKALRSGRWKQGEGCLAVPRAPTPSDVRSRPPTQKNAYFCCLGVLAKVNRARWNDVWEPSGGDAYTYGEGIIPHKAMNELAAMNDEGISFTEIADWIEENIDGA